MSMPNGYDAWKTTSPFDEGDDESCIVCGMGLADDPKEGTHDWDGFCSLPCQYGYEYWQELCAATEIGVTISPKLWRPDCVRPMFDLLCGQLQQDSGDGKTDNVERWSKTIYSGTSCGASLRLLDNQTIEIGSIVEGVDEGAEPYALTWPFTIGAFWDAVKTVEARCSDIWKATHGCSECAHLNEYAGDDGLEEPPQGEDGSTPINPDCPTCHGHGIVI